MVSVNKFRSEDFSVYFFVKGVVGSGITVVDGYPYTEIEEDTLVVPSIAVEHTQTYDNGGEMGASWYNRQWNINVFAKNDAQRDELSSMIYDALDNAIPIRDYSGGFRADGKSLSGADLRIIEYAPVFDRSMRPTYMFTTFSEKKYWRMVINFSTQSTKAT